MAAGCSEGVEGVSIDGDSISVCLAGFVVVSIVVLRTGLLESVALGKRTASGRLASDARRLGASVMSTEGLFAGDFGLFEALLGDLALSRSA